VSIDSELQNMCDTHQCDKFLELHLLEYHKQVCEYLECFRSLQSGWLEPLVLELFSGPHDKCGYNDSPISHDLITEIFLEFSDKTCRVW
jgi:hypothetical protein